MPHFVGHGVALGLIVEADVADSVFLFDDELFRDAVHRKSVHGGSSLKLAVFFGGLISIKAADCPAC